MVWPASPPYTCKVALKTFHGLYLSDRIDQAALAIAPTVDDWEMLALVNHTQVRGVSATLPRSRSALYDDPAGICSKGMRPIGAGTACAPPEQSPSARRCEQ